MGEVYSHLSEKERQVIRIEIGNGTSIRGIGALLGRNVFLVKLAGIRFGTVTFCWIP